MEWRGKRQSDNIEDRRGSGGKRKTAVGGLGMIIIAAIVFFLGGDPFSVLDLGQMMQPQAPQSNSTPQELSAQKEFVGSVLASTEDVWSREFQKLGGQYRPPILVMFDYQTSSECGGASSSTGPFYCPMDKKVYLDYSFFDQLSQQYGARGEFANAYVIAHEIGHHVQDLLGISGKVQAMQRRASRADANKLSVMLELQADFLAGYWARRASGLELSKSDIQSALTAANSIGDDRLQKQSQGYVVPDAFTHGTSQQRMEWFMRGFNAQSLDEGNTFENM